MLVDSEPKRNALINFQESHLFGVRSVVALVEEPTHLLSLPLFVCLQDYEQPCHLS